VSNVSCVFFFFFFSSRRRHTRCLSDWSSDVCSSDLAFPSAPGLSAPRLNRFQLCACTLNLLQNLLQFGGPDKGTRILVPPCQERLDGRDQIRHAEKRPTPHRLLRQFAKPALD